MPHRYSERAAARSLPAAPDGVMQTISQLLRRQFPHRVMRCYPGALERTPKEFVHWMTFNIPGTAQGLPQAVPNDARLTDGSVQLKNSGWLFRNGCPMKTGGPYPFSDTSFSCIADRMNRR